MNFLFERLFPEVILGVIFWGQIPPKQLTQLQSSAIITGYKGRQDQVDTPEFKQSILGQFLEHVMHFLSQKYTCVGSQLNLQIEKLIKQP